MENCWGGVWNLSQVWFSCEWIMTKGMVHWVGHDNVSHNISQWHTEGLWRPFPLACQTGKRRRRSPSLGVVWGRALALNVLGVFGREWSPFLNNVNTISNSTYQIRLTSTEGALPRFWGSRAEPQPPTCLEYLGVIGTHFWIASTPFSTLRVRLASAKGAQISTAIVGKSPSRQRLWEHLGAYGTHFWIALTPFSTLFGAHCGPAAACGPIVM